MIYKMVQDSVRLEVGRSWKDFFDQLLLTFLLCERLTVYYSSGGVDFCCVGVVTILWNHKRYRDVQVKRRYLWWLNVTEYFSKMSVYEPLSVYVRILKVHKAPEFRKTGTFRQSSSVMWKTRSQMSCQNTRNDFYSITWGFED